MCEVETMTGCWGYLCSECQDEWNALIEDLRRAEARASSLSQELLAARDARDINRARAEAAEALLAEAERLLAALSRDAKGVE